MANFTTYIDAFGNFVIEFPSGDLIVRGTDGDDDFIPGDTGDDILYGFNGNDKMHGGDGDDILDGGKGNDLLFGGSGNDVLLGRGGSDILFGDIGNDLIKGGGGSDSAAGGFGRDRVFLNNGDDIGSYTMIFDDGSNDYYHGGKGYDTLLIVLVDSAFNASQAFADELTTHFTATAPGLVNFNLLPTPGFRFDLIARKFEAIAFSSTPVAIDDTGSTDEDTALVVPAAIGVLVNDIDVDGDSLVVNVGLSDAVSALGALVTMSADGSYTYDPSVSATLNSLAVGVMVDDTFDYVVTDNDEGSDTGTVVITVTGVNDPPTAIPDSAATDEDTDIDIDVVNGAGADTDPDIGDVLMVDTFDGISAKGATITLNFDGTLNYDPTTSAMLNALAVGVITEDSFDYVVKDGNGGSSMTTVTVTITGVNDPPTSSGPLTLPTVSVSDPSFNVSEATLLANNSDVDIGDVLNISSLLVTSGNGGGVTLLGDNFTLDPTFYTITAGDTEIIEFSYSVDDGNGGLVAQTASITILGPPVLKAVAYRDVNTNGAYNEGTDIAYIKVFDVDFDGLQSNGDIVEFGVFPIDFVGGTDGAVSGTIGTAILQAVPEPFEDAAGVFLDIGGSTHDLSLRSRDQSVLDNPFQGDFVQIVTPGLFFNIILDVVTAGGILGDEDIIEYPSVTLPFSGLSPLDIADPSSVGDDIFLNVDFL